MFFLIILVIPIIQNQITQHRNSRFPKQLSHINKKNSLNLTVNSTSTYTSLLKQTNSHIKGAKYMKVDPSFSQKISIIEPKPLNHLHLWV